VSVADLTVCAIARRSRVRAIAIHWLISAQAITLNLRKPAVPDVGSFDSSLACSFMVDTWHK
jgi:hypothetical protein